MRHARIDGRRQYAFFSQVLHLILHQGNEWCDDDAHALHRQCRHLEGDALAATRRHQPERVVPGHDGFNNLLLYAAEAVVAPVLL